MTGNKLPPDLKKLPVEDLIAIFADKNQDQHILDRAFSEFNDRYAAYVYKVCINTCAVKCIFNHSEVEEIAHNAMISAYMGSKTFNATGPEVTAEGKHKRVCGWLGTITRNTVYKYVGEIMALKEKIIFTENIDDFSDVVNEIADESEEFSTPSAESLQLEEALTHIKERDKEITFIYLTFEDENGNIPPEIQARIIQKYNLLPKYPAKIKHRTIDKLLQINPINLILKNHDTKNQERTRQVRGRTKKLPPLDGPDVSGDTSAG